MRLYMRKDIAAKIWNYGAAPAAENQRSADPFEGKQMPAERRSGHRRSRQPAGPVQPPA